MREVVSKIENLKNLSNKSEFKKESELTLSEKQIINYNFVILRDKKTDKGINVAYTIEGLKWTINKTGRNLYVDKPQHKIIILKDNKMIFNKDITISNKVYIEKFYPRKFKNPFFNKCESIWVNKALHKI